MVRRGSKPNRSAQGQSIRLAVSRASKRKRVPRLRRNRHLCRDWRSRPLFQRRGQPSRFSRPRLRRHASSWSMVHMAPDGRARNGSTHGTRNGFHRRKRNFVGSARQRKSRGDPYGADLVLQAAPPLDLVRMQEADRVAPWHRRFKHWVFRTETRTFPAVPDNGKVRIIRVCGAGTRERLRPYFSIHP